MNPLDRSFGQLTVESHERRALIREVFTGVAPRYDLMNDLMSFGIHRLWKRRMASVAGDVQGRGLAIDLAGGTGDVARLLQLRGWQVTVCDPSVAMMRAGQTRASGPLAWLAGEAESLPLANASVDLLTISFGIRNVTQLEAALREIRRVLAPGGRFVCLEFSRPAWWLAPGYDLYSRWVIPRLGATVAGQPSAYRYLIESIRRFPDQREFAALITQAGFAGVRWENPSFGIAALHTGYVP